MPVERRRRRRRDPADGFRVPGAYQRVLRKTIGWRLGPDYRLRLTATDDAWSAHKREADRNVEVEYQRMFAAGEPVVGPAWLLGGHSVPLPAAAPRWLRLACAVRQLADVEQARAAPEFTDPKFLEVDADDVVRPADTPAVA